MKLVESWLYDITNVLLLPVTAALLALLAFALLALGGFAREWFDRRLAISKWRDDSRSLLDRSASREARIERFVTRRDWPGMIARFAAESESATDPAAIRTAADRCEVEASRRVARLNLVARAGPTLGLIATLIPMGPALLALADNDVSSLARSLVVAFTATIVGLLVGLACAAMATAKRHWYAEDLVAIDALVDSLAEPRP